MASHPASHLTPVRVFTYGTLMPGEFYHAQYCEGKILKHCDAIAYGQLFDLPFGYPAMTEGNELIYGVLLTFADAAVLKELDELEDYDPDRPIEQNDYLRREIEVFDLQQQSLGFAWTYVMSLEQVQQSNGIWLPQGKWSRKLRAES